MRNSRRESSRGCSASAMEGNNIDGKDGCLWRGSRLNNLGE